MDVSHYSIGISYLLGKDRSTVDAFYVEFFYITYITGKKKIYLD
jgi:hypothetical protein